MSLFSGVDVYRKTMKTPDINFLEERTKHVIDLSPTRSMEAFRRATIHSQENSLSTFPLTGLSSALEPVAGLNLNLNVIGGEERTVCGKMVLLRKRDSESKLVKVRKYNLRGPV